MINETQATRLALAYLQADSRGYSFRTLAVKKNLPRDWSVVVQAVASDGAVVTGSIILIVDEEAGSVRTLDDALAAGWRADRP